MTDTDESPSAGEFSRTHAELANVFGVSLASIRYWSQKKGAPEREEQGFRNSAWIQWHLEYKSGGSGDDDAEKKARTDYEVARARKMQLVVQQLEGELIDSGKVESMLGSRAAIFRADLERMARELAPRLAEEPDWRAIERRIRDRIHDILRSYLAKLPASLTRVDPSLLEEEEEEAAPKKKRTKSRTRKKAKGKRGRRK